MSRRVSGITFISRLKIEGLKSQIITSFGSNITKGQKQDSQKFAKITFDIWLLLMIRENGHGSYFFFISSDRQDAIFDLFIRTCHNATFNNVI
jgi:hypothetical protein